MQECTKCHQFLPDDDFPYRSKEKGIKRKDCKNCNSKRANRWAKQNPEKRKKILERFYENHSGKDCQYCNKWYKPQGDIRFCSYKCNLLGNVKKTVDKCWEWQGSLGKNGYGKSYCNGKGITAHRLSYTIFKGKIPDKILVLHTCDNKKCINPDHLYLGDHKQNVKDCVDRGRRKPYFFKTYSWKDVEECYNLRMKGNSYEEISKKTGISIMGVWKMIKKWNKFKT